MMLGQQLPPPGVADLGCPGGGPDDVRKQDGRQHLVRLGCLPRRCFLQERDHLGQDLARGNEHNCRICPPAGPQ